MHDLLLWLLPATRKFPRDYRFTLAQRINNQAFDLQDALIAASLDDARRSEHWVKADIALQSLRKLFLLCHELALFSPGQYRHVSQMTAEVGRLLGGWRRSGR
jgi:hypothetical protein